MSLRFGTDGIRGVANTELTPEIALALGRAAAEILGVPEKPFLVGRDTRQSGDMLQAALSAGVASTGGDVVDLGVLPTPAVAYMSSADRVPAAMISASHNPFFDNGIKFFAPGGKKLSDQVEQALEERLFALMGAAVGVAGEHGAQVGSVGVDRSGAGRYAAHLTRVCSAGPLNGQHVILDCANGAASDIAPKAFRATGATVQVIHNQPNGRNINDRCGSTHPETLQQAVVSGGADVGLAFDGDADRVLAVDHAGNLVNGDQIIAMLAIDRHAKGLLDGDTVVVTVMSNLGFRLAMQHNGIALHETNVGDRFVTEALEAGGWSLGGEQSGHIIFPRLSTTGDGLLTGLEVLSLMKRRAMGLAELAEQAMTVFPQVLRNVRVGRREALDGSQAVWDEVRRVEEELGEEGRVLLRPSGTEPVIRVMVEARTLDIAQSVCERLCRSVADALA